MDVGIHSLDHFSLVAPDLEEAATFYDRFGLQVRSAGDELTLHTVGSAHRWGRFRSGAVKTLDYLSFGAFAEDVPTFHERLRARRVARLPAPAHAVDDSGIWFRDDDGTLIEIRVADKVSPDTKSSVSNPTASPGVAAMPLRVDAPPSSRGAFRTCSSSRAMSRERSISTARPSDSASQTRRATPSPSCTACMAATIISWRSENPTLRAFTTAAGTSSPPTMSDSVR
jgi:catechol 2,3-dioxygenase-like lactoylglutathione lyase family enzyme